ncbi:MAG: hypothetical protein BWX66_00762 [Deltaproteobacteria bacterium ADurb.Bin058]|nr:MAG: hypothetical protein BWX66_00762 [Deltaproteobacteria bacterium ADurb.Bin058]
MTYCLSCQSEIDSSASICPHCAFPLTKPTDKGGGFIADVVTRPKIQVRVDLATTVDRTGSTERFQEGIPKAYGMILDHVSKKAREVKCWLATHGDIDCLEYPEILTDGGQPSQAIEDIKNISYGGGGDPAEHHLDSIEFLLNTVPWTNDPSVARGAIIAFMTADTKPTKSGISAAELGRRIASKGLILYLICEVTPTLWELAQAANGLVFPISNDPDPLEMQKIGSQLAASIVATIKGGGTVPMVASL